MFYWYVFCTIHALYIKLSKHLGEKGRININSFAEELTAAKDKKILPDTACQTNTAYGLIVICMSLLDCMHQFYHYVLSNLNQTNSLMVSI